MEQITILSNDKVSNIKNLAKSANDALTEIYKFMDKNSCDKCMGIDEKNARHIYSKIEKAKILTQAITDTFD